MVYAAILAGGIGKRIEKFSVPKQFISISSTPIIVITLREFLKNTRFENIYIAVHKNWKKYLYELLQRSFSQDEINRIIIVNGGKERLDSFLNIMNAIIERHGLNNDDILICHDSVRPFVSQQMINDCIDATIENGLALTVVPTTDTIHIAHDKKFIDATLDRNGLYNGQNPSGFSIKILKSAINNFGDDVKSQVTGTTQLLLKLGYKIRIVNGHTSNFKITTDNDIDIADRMIRSRPKIRKIKILDCTLRDGGIVINFNYGLDQMQNIKRILEISNVEYIETGYIDEKNGSPKGRTCFNNEISIEKTLLSSGKKPGIIYVAMIDYGMFDVTKLKLRSEAGIDGIRLAFHKENWESSLELGKIILEKGYDLFIQPMVTTRYTYEEYKRLIGAINCKLKSVSGFYIVDSFGQMDNAILIRMLEIADEYLASSISLGFHAHNNRQMAYSNALSCINYNAKHNIIIDASIMGMGKGAGNLCTELIETALINEGKIYNTKVIYNAISEYFSEQQKKTPWGYNLDYYLSSLYSCTPSYIKIFKEDKRVTTDILIDLLKTMPEEKKFACDRKFADKYLRNTLNRIQKNFGISEDG